MQKNLLLFEPKHYRYIITGLIVYSINLYLLDFLEYDRTFPIVSDNIFYRMLISSELALVISFPLHNFFTFAKGVENIGTKLLNFVIAANFIQVIRFLVFYLLFKLFDQEFAANVISLSLVLLLNFITFEMYVFNSNEYKAFEEEPYSEMGSGVATLETIEEAHNYNIWVAEKIEDYLSERNLELGAGKGTISSILAESYQLELYEISETNCRYLESRFKNHINIKSIKKNFLTNKKYEQYDCIYSSNVLEHIENDEEFLLHGMRLLRKGGFFVAVVPAMMILYSDFDRQIGHYRRYTKKDLSRFKSVLEKNKINFKLIEFKYFNQIGFFGWMIKMKLLRQNVIKKSDAMLINSIVPFISFLDYLPFPFGQSLVIVIKKKN